jgi:type IX secretion system substrate protein
MKEKLQFLKKAGFTLIALLGFANFANAQCAAGEVEVTLDITTDGWGYEMYWEVVPSGNACGTGTIAFGGNTNVGCSPVGDNTSTAGAGDPGAYINDADGTTNPIITTPSFCLTIGQDYDLIMTDDWGDGGNTASNPNQGINAAPSSATEVFTFTALAPPSGPDASIGGTRSEYTMYPLSQVGNIVGTPSIENIGVGDATLAAVTVNVYDNTLTQVYTETSATNTVAEGTAVDFSVTGYTPTTAGAYFVEYIASINEVDGNNNNDTSSYVVLIDSVYARDAADLVGVQGIVGIGTGQGGQYGNVFTITVDDTLTQVGAFISNSNGALNGENLVAKIYSWTGTASTEIGSTVPVALDSAVNMNTYFELDIVGGGLILGPGMYIIAVQENATNASIGHTGANNYTTDGTVVNATGFTTDFGDQASQYGGNKLTPVIRGIFANNPVITVGVEENDNNNIVVMPNPAVNNLMVKNLERGSTVEIYNNLGQVVFSELVNTNNLSINVSNFDNGIYTIKNINNDNVITNTFVKQ